MVSRSLAVASEKIGVAEDNERCRVGPAGASEALVTSAAGRRQHRGLCTG